jgi:hypothetical protein
LLDRFRRLENRLRCFDPALEDGQGLADDVVLTDCLDGLALHKVGGLVLLLGFHVAFLSFGPALCLSMSQIIHPF